MLRQKPRKLLIILFPFDLHIQPTSNSYWFISHIPILITSQHLYFNYCSQSLDPHSLELVITRLTLKLNVSPLFSTVQWRVITLVIKSLLLTRWPFKMLHNKSFPSHTLYALSTTILPLFLLEGIKLILVQRLYDCSFFSKKLLSSRFFYSFVLIQKKKKKNSSNDTLSERAPLTALLHPLSLTLLLILLYFLCVTHENLKLNLLPFLKKYWCNVNSFK